MRYIKLMIVAILWATIVVTPAAAADFDQSHGTLERVLSRFVRDARVDYAGLKANPKELDSYANSLSAVPETEFRRWPEKDRLSFLINLYNAQTLRLIIHHYPVRSIKKIGSIRRGPWDQPVVPLFGRMITLAELEHKIIRKEYPDPRAHFALVCAAKGCPPLRGEPYVADRLDAQLEEQGRLFISQRQKNRWEDGVLFLSPIFEWFKEDFVNKSGSVTAFVAPYFPEPARREILTSAVKIEFTDYDWSLNDNN